MVTLSSIGDFKARGPQFLRDAVGWARPVSGGLNLGFYPIRCSFGLGYFYETWGTALLPLVLFLSFWAVEFLRAKLKREGRVQSQSLWTCGVLVLYLMYPSVVETLLAGTQYLSCCTSCCSFGHSVHLSHTRCGGYALPNQGLPCTVLRGHSCRHHGLLRPVSHYFCPRLSRIHIRGAVSLQELEWCKAHELSSR